MAVARQLFGYLLSYRAFQKLYALTRLAWLMPWQMAVNVDVTRPYGVISRTKAAQDATGLAALGATLAALLVAAVKTVVGAVGLWGSLG